MTDAATVLNDGQWLAVYLRHGSTDVEPFTTEDDGLAFLHYGEEHGQHSMVALLGPGRKWTSQEIEQHFQAIYLRDHADEIAERKRQAEEAKQRHEQWLAEQPAWKRDKLSDLVVTTDGGYTRVVIHGHELPFIVDPPEANYDSRRGHYIRLEIPIAPGVTYFHESRGGMSLTTRLAMPDSPSLTNQAD